MKDNFIENNINKEHIKNTSGHIIEVENLYKFYPLYNKPMDRLKEVVSLTHKSYHKDFYALEDINFTVEKGETFGIIGVNGSGKSTLLKILTGVLTETKGTKKVNGKVSALLELGAGFNMDYTGIENIYLNGTMMGFSKKEMDEKLNDILEFADIGVFVNQPVKNYSSGMFVRLAFALSISVNPDILIVDEALSVGDIFFQSKCYKRMDELKEKGTTIIMVTHDLGAVIKYCDRTLLLDKGHQIAIGSPHDMVDLYKKILSTGNANDEDEKKESESNDTQNEVNDEATKIKNKMSLNANPNIYGDGKAEFIDFGILDKNGKPTSVILKGETFTIKEKIEFYDDVKSPIFTFTIKDKRGQELTGTNTMLERKMIDIAKKGETYEVSFTQSMRLMGGDYLLSMSTTSFEGENLVPHKRMYDIISLTVLSNENKVGIFDSESITEVNKVK